MRFKGVKPSSLEQSLLTKLRPGRRSRTYPRMHSTTFYACANISTYTIHVHSSARRYWLRALSILNPKESASPAKMATGNQDLGRVILNLSLDLSYLQKKPSPLSKQSSTTSGIIHHQILPTNQQKVSGHYQLVQSLPSGGWTIPPPLASTRADMPCLSAGAPCRHHTLHTGDVASTPCQHCC